MFVVARLLCAVSANYCAYTLFSESGWRKCTTRWRRTVHPVIKVSAGRIFYETWRSTSETVCFENFCEYILRHGNHRRKQGCWYELEIMFSKLSHSTSLRFSYPGQVGRRSLQVCNAEVYVLLNTATSTLCSGFLVPTSLETAAPQTWTSHAY